MAAAFGEKKVLTSDDIQRAGCPRLLVPCYEEELVVPGDKGATVQYTTMRLLHSSKAGLAKNQLELAKIHDDLRIAVGSITLNGGASNLLVAKTSFDVLLTLTDGSQERAFISFDLKVPGAADTGMSYDYLKTLYQGRDNLYPVLEYLYDQGRSIANPADAKHGVTPSYDADTTEHDQYILHTEQMLAAYLAHPKAATMLVNRLRAEIRAKYPNVQAAKVYNMSLHMHSTKTCCAPCEYALLGLMNTKGPVPLTEEEGGVKKTVMVFSFIHHFKQECLKGHEVMPFTVPKTGVQLFVTVTADEHDANHKADIPVKSATVVPILFDIELKRNPAAYQRLYLSKFSAPFYDATSTPSNLSDKTVALSGSSKTKGSPITLEKVAATRKDEGVTIVMDLMGRLGLD